MRHGAEHLQTGGPAARIGRGRELVGVALLAAGAAVAPATVAVHGMTRGEPVSWLALASLAVLLALLARERRRAAANGHAAGHDPLTGVANRRLLELLYSSAIARAKRSGHPPALLLADIDGFKALNDVHGHRAGDEALALIAQRLTAAARASDVVARVGGDEFALLLDGGAGSADIEAAVRRAKAGIERAMAEPLAVRCSVVRVSVSVGAATAQAGEPLAALLERADRTMYAAKRSRHVKAV